MAKSVKQIEVPEPELACADILRVWRTMAPQLDILSEKDMWELLEYEKTHSKRILFMQRIYGRASSLRGKREAKELRTLAENE